GARRRDLIWIVAFVTECGARNEIRTDVEKRLKVAAITGFTASEMEGNWQAPEVGLQVNLGRETATRAAKRLIMLPPFAPAAETWARTTVESNIWAKCAVSLIAARASKNASKVPAKYRAARTGGRFPARGYGRAAAHQVRGSPGPRDQ